MALAACRYKIKERRLLQQFTLEDVCTYVAVRCSNLNGLVYELNIQSSYENVIQIIFFTKYEEHIVSINEKKTVRNYIEPLF